MPRKKRTTLAGTDPEYTTDFSQPLPTNKIATPEPQDAVPAPANPKPLVEKTKQPAPKKTTTKPKPSPKPAMEPKKPKPKPVAKSDPSEKREIAVAAAVKVDQDAKLRALETKGISPKDVITIAGRRAVDRFEPKPEFIPKAEAERMPMREGYKSTKRVSAAMLDALRNEHDPLRLSSDGAMLRGQFEPLFWTVLDEVIGELTERFS
ncbi:MAG: hypothetical protein AAGA63_11995 [Pseudomonadota bacterium]